MAIIKPREKKKKHIIVHKHSLLSIEFSWYFNDKKKHTDTTTLQQIYSNSSAQEEKGTDLRG